MVIPILGWIVGGLGMIAAFCCWIMAIIMAYGGEKWKVPVIGNYAEKFANQQHVPSKRSKRQQAPSKADRGREVARLLRAI